MYEIIDEVSLRYAIKDYLRFYSEERPPLYLLIRLFSGIGYSVGTSDDNASWRTSDGVLQPYLSCGWGIIKSEMYQMYEIIDEVSLRYAIKDYLRFYSEELLLICPLSSRQVKYLKLDVDDACISF